MTIDTNNYKPFRTAAQKKVAREQAYKKNGTWYSNAPKSFHKTKIISHKAKQGASRCLLNRD
jgi:hypothetical protein